MSSAECIRKNHYHVEEAVVAIPVGLECSKEKDTRDAAASAGIRILLFVSEPTAAFFANYRDIRNENTVAVFDWGVGNTRCFSSQAL